jgi:hypothetical protein
MVQDNGPRSPGGIPISSRLLVPEGAAFAPVRRALAAIDAVHGDGDLPRIPVVRTRAVTEAGAYQWSDRTGEALRLRLSSLGEHLELTVVHEIGHFLDHQGIGRPGIFASETGVLVSLMQAIDRTDAVNRLRSLRARRRVIVDERGRREAEVVRQSHVAYLLQSNELFARAYAQFVTVESQHPLLLDQLNYLRSLRRTRVYHDIWTDDDFVAVASELRRLFGRRRWMRSQ